MKTQNILLILAGVFIVLIVGLFYFMTLGSDLGGEVTQTVITTRNSDLGNIMTGTNGMTLYVFEADVGGESSCYGQCAQFWPPLLVGSNVKPVGDGISAVLEVTQRTDGTYQVVANGMPLYFYANDNSPGDTNGQGSTGAGALWWVLSPTGQKITTLLGDSTVPQTGQDSSQEPNRYEVEIEDFSYNPQTLTVKVGDMVTWKNRDSVGHTVTSDDGITLDSELLNRDEEFSYVFSEAGTYSYYCAPHPRMKGTIVVQ
jgi:plastocyanin